MKRTLYDMFGLPRNADEAQIERAFQALSAQLAAAVNRGDPDAANESIMVKEGYEILRDPVRRKHYDTTLGSIKTGVTFFPEDTKSRSKLGIETGILIVLAAVFGGVVYHQLNKGMEAVQTEHRQALLVKRGAQASPAIVAPAAAETQEPSAGQ